jgi:hypothetical protein
MKTIGFTLGSLLVAVALVGAGCGGDDESAGDTTTTETTTDTTTTEDTETPPPGTALRGTTGPGFEISMSTADGDPLTTLQAGSYELEVEDLSTIHNFRLSGAGVDVSTDVSEEGTQTFTVELQPGTYTFVCDPHASSMRGSFEVS